MLPLLIFLGSMAAALLIVLMVIHLNRRSRQKKIATYTGSAPGIIVSIQSKDSDSPWVIHVSYQVDGIEYHVSETAKLKSETIRIAGVPVGHQKTFAMGPVKEGDQVEIRYDPAHPEKAIIRGNEGLVTN